MSDPRLERHPVYRVSHIGRPVDPHYPTNRAVLVLMPAVGVIAAAMAGCGVSWEQRLALFLLGGATVFLTWALGRELAPDDNAAAFLGVTAVSAPLFLGAPLDLVTASVVICLARIVNRTIGPSATARDLTIVVLGVAALVPLRGDWLLAAIAALALHLNSALRDPCGRSRVASAVCVVLALVGLSIALGPLPESCALRHPLVLAAAALALGFMLIIRGQPEPTCEADLGGPVDRARVQAGMTVTLLVALTSLGAGPEGVLAASPLWAAILGVTLGRLFSLARG